jgi:hypothetical protein
MMNVPRFMLISKHVNALSKKCSHLTTLRELCLVRSENVENVEILYLTSRTWTLVLTLSGWLFKDSVCGLGDSTATPKLRKTFVKYQLDSTLRVIPSFRYHD